MPHRYRLPEEIRFDTDIELTPSPDRALKNFRYVVGSVNEDAQKAWTDIWEQLKNGMTPAGEMAPENDSGFKPDCGWSEFLEKFWLLKHYLDYTRRLCKGPS